MLNPLYILLMAGYVCLIYQAYKVIGKVSSENKLWHPIFTYGIQGFLLCLGAYTFLYSLYYVYNAKP